MKRFIDKAIAFFRFIFSKNGLLFIKILIQDFFERCRWFFWDAGIKLSWYRLWIRKNEFHKSLDYDDMATMYMSGGQEREYLEDLMRRRNIAHKRDLENNLD